MTNEEAIDELKRIRHHGTERLIKALEVAISALESQRWIPVTERLPEKTEKIYRDDLVSYIPVLTFERDNGVTMNNRVFMHKGNEIVDRVFDTEEWYWIDEGDVTHWMPLPKPPKEEN